MPQMSPLKWMYLYTYFSSIMMIFYMIIYYTNHFKPLNENILSINQPIFLKWKW
nr:ATP synthase F0 subunit 8 [Systropus sp. 2 YXA-2022a]